MKKFSFLIALLWSGLALTEDKAFNEALSKTQDMLKDRSQREEAIKAEKDGAKADNRVKELAPDSATQDKYYELAAEIFGNFKNEDSMTKGMDQAQRDPAAFYQSLTPEQKQKIKELSEKLNPGAKSNP